MEGTGRDIWALIIPVKSSINNDGHRSLPMINLYLIIYTLLFLLDRIHRANNTHTNHSLTEF